MLFPFLKKQPVKIITILFLAFVFFVLPKSTLASSEFTIQQTILYQFQKNDYCQVTHQITMKNNFSKIYATQYSLNINSSEKIKNIKAESQDNLQLETSVDRSDRHLTQIVIHFKEPVTGRDKTQNFEISYLMENYAEKIGQTHRILIPKLENSDSINQLNIKVQAPQSFGKLSFVSPKNYQYQTDQQIQTITFDKAGLAEKEIMIIFGDIQALQFNLKYFLENKSDFAQEKIIALPPDTTYQRIYLDKINPSPHNITVDKDGNWIAHYRLEPHQPLTIEAQGEAHITADPKITPLKIDNFQIYLQPQPFWEVEDDKIRQIAKNLNSPQQIYQYVIEKLDYNFERIRNEKIERKGALAILAEPKQAICSEFTDLFVALARAAGIPAREINGYAYSTNPELLPSGFYSDVLHSWPEYWHSQKKTWYQVDPTWEETSHIDYFNKMDMTHLALVIHGQNSQEPLPAGAYQKENQPQKNVNISFTSPSEDIMPPQPEIEFSLPDQLFPKKKEKATIIVKNPYPAAIYNLKINITGKDLIIEGEKEKEFAVIPPQGWQEIPINIIQPSFFSPNISQIIVTAQNNGKSRLFQKDITIKSFINLSRFVKSVYFYPSLIIFGAIIIFFIVKIFL